jgi:hypothetical protein
MELERLLKPPPLPEAFTLLWALIGPALLVETWRPGGIRNVPLILLFGLIIWRILRSRSRVPTSA